MAGNDNSAVNVREPRHYHRRRPPIEDLNQDMCRSDLIRALRYLIFVNDASLIRLDRGVRDYLVRALNAR
jgi:hypothetical protein